MKPITYPHASRLGALAALAAVALASSAPALAQETPAPTGITLTCSAPRSSNTVTQNTAATIWGVDIGTGVTPATTESNGGWSAGPATWIGGSATVGGLDPTAVTYTLAVNVSDPNIVLSSAQISYSYLVDNHVDGITWNGTALPYNDATSYNTAAASYSGNPVTLVSGTNTLAFSTTNAGNPYGLNAAVTLTYDCAPPVVPTSVPVDNPWALAALVAALGVAGAGFARHRKAGQRG